MNPIAIGLTAFFIVSSTKPCCACKEFNVIYQTLHSANQLEMLNYMVHVVENSRNEFFILPTARSNIYWMWCGYCVSCDHAFLSLYMCY